MWSRGAGGGRTASLSSLGPTPCRSGALVVWPEKGAGRRGVPVVWPRPHDVGVAAWAPRLLCLGGAGGGGAPVSAVRTGGRPGFPASGGLLSWPSASALRHVAQHVRPVPPLAGPRAVTGPGPSNLSSGWRST